jgi:hypothetical protein
MNGSVRLAQAAGQKYARRMARPLDQPFDENDEIVGVTMVREDLRLLLVVARIHQMEEQERGRAPDARLQLAMDRIGATATSAEWHPKKAD